MPCIKEVPLMNQLLIKYRDSNVVFIAPTFENTEKVKKFIDKYKPLMIMSPNNKQYCNELDLIYYPTNIIIDRNGFIYKTYTGSIPDIDKVLSNEIEFLLKLGE
jgi:thiol-disulfide isomerase/thioredoxin